MLRQTDETTIQYYEDHADVFVKGTITAEMREARERFLMQVPKGACILDFGCGSGRDTKAFLDAGYYVEATDGSAQLCRKAAEYTGIPVKQMLFQELEAKEAFDGIWACSSILHLPKPELLVVLRKIKDALKLGGVLYTSFKYGVLEGYRNGRYFSDFTEETLMRFWVDVPLLQIFDTWITRDVRPGREEERWINLLARRV